MENPVPEYTEHLKTCALFFAALPIGSGVAIQKFLGGQIFEILASNRILFGTLI